ncbi:MAG: TetR/AcrR family transcriptional regulator [Opitutae bacterium]|nr:TetR/AcrR family transcriptional regulator [Opitutae bacterium]
MKTKKKADRRVRRTQQSLYRALLELTLKHGYEAVSVGDIIAHADVGRSTFYAHYAGKEGLLLSGLNLLRDHLLEHQRAAQAAPENSPGRLLGFSSALFEHVDSHRDLYRALGQSGGGLVMARIRSMLSDLVRLELAAARRPERSDDIPRGAVVNFVCDALVSQILWWCEKNPRLTPAEVDSIFRRLVVPSVRAACLG